MARRSKPAASTAASPEETAAADAFLAHVGRVMAPAGPHPRGAARSDWAVTRPGGPAPPPAPAEPGATPARLVCGSCGWAVDCLAADAGAFAAAGCLRCRRGPAGDQPSATVGPREAEAGRPPGRPGDKRRRLRRAPTGSVRVSIRRAADPDQADLAVALADVSGEGLGVWLTAPVLPGEAVAVTIARRSGRPVEAEADVRWCAPGGGCTYRAGLRLRRDLSRAELADLTM